MKSNIKALLSKFFMLTLFTFSFSFSGCGEGLNILLNNTNHYVTSGHTTTDLPPLAPTLNIYSYFDVPFANFSAQTVDTDIDYFECRIDSGSWFECSSPSNIDDNGAALSYGFSGTLGVRAVDLSGNTGAITTKNFMRTELPRGFDRNVYNAINIPGEGIMVSGTFKEMAPQISSGLVRVKSDGTMDLSLPGIKAGFYDYWGADIYSIVNEIETDGAPNSKIYVAGSFSLYNGENVPDCLVRLNSDGSLDTTFNNGGSGFAGGGHIAIVVQELSVATGLPTGKILVGGWCATTYNGTNTPDNLVRLNNDGSIDSSFNNGGNGITGDVESIIQERDTSGNLTGNILIGGSLTMYNGSDVPDRLIRLDSTGAFDATFNNGGTGFTGGANTSIYSIKQEINTGTGLPTGNLLIGGCFTDYNGLGTTPSYLLRLDSNGTFDGTFNAAGSGANNTVFSISFELDGAGNPTGNLFIGGSFSFYNGVDVPNYVIRVFSDGTWDNSFNNGGNGFYGSPVNQILSELDTSGIPTGKLIVSGNFYTYNYNDVPGRYIKLLSSDGSIDPAFMETKGFEDYVGAAVQEIDSNGLPTGYVWIGGSFGEFSGTQEISDGIAMLNNDGSSVSTFNNGETGFYRGTVGYPYVKPICVERDVTGLLTGNYFVGGEFYYYNDVDIPNHLIKIGSDGARDSSFMNAGSGFNDDIEALLLELNTSGIPTGKIIVGGGFTALNGSVVPDYLIRLNSDGTHDNTFNNGGSGCTGRVRFLTPELDASGNPTGKIWVAGSMTDYNGTDIPDWFIRMNSDGSWDSTYNGAGSGFSGGVSDRISIVVHEFDTSGNVTGKLLVGGSFTTYNGIDVPDCLLRLNSDGSVDGTFNVSGIGFSSQGNVNSIVQELDSDEIPTGKIYVAGLFTTYGGNSVSMSFVRLNSDGSLDTTFINGEAGFYREVHKVLLDRDSDDMPTGKIIVVGNIEHYNGQFVNKICRLENDGTLDLLYQGPGK